MECACVSAVFCRSGGWNGRGTAGPISLHPSDTSPQRDAPLSPQRTSPLASPLRPLARPAPPGQLVPRPPERAHHDQAGALLGRRPRGVGVGLRARVLLEQVDRRDRDVPRGGPPRGQLHPAAPLRAHPRHLRDRLRREALLALRAPGRAERRPADAAAGGGGAHQRGDPGAEPQHLLRATRVPAPHAAGAENGRQLANQCDACMYIIILNTLSSIGCVISCISCGKLCDQLYQLGGQLWLAV